MALNTRGGPLKGLPFAFELDTPEVAGVVDWNSPMDGEHIVWDVLSELFVHRIRPIPRWATDMAHLSGIYLN